LTVFGLDLLIIGMWWLLLQFIEAQPGPRRGPPRGPVKGPQSHFFGKEGEHQPSRGIPLPTIVIAVAVALALVAIKLYFKPPATNKVNAKNK